MTEGDSGRPHGAGSVLSPVAAAVAFTALVMALAMIGLPAPRAQATGPTSVLSQGEARFRAEAPVRTAVEPEAISLTLALTLTGQAAGDYFGNGQTAGDVNGDGYADVVAAATGYDGNRGRAYLYLGQFAFKLYLPAVFRLHQQ